MVRGWRRGRRARTAQPSSSVEPAFGLSHSLDELDATARPAALSATFDGLDDRDNDRAMMRTSATGRETGHPTGPASTLAWKPLRL